jgi:hypothetical protein
MWPRGQVTQWPGWCKSPVQVSVCGGRFALALTWLAYLRKQSKIGWPYPIVIDIVELVVFAFDVERTEMDRPIIGLNQINADAPVVQRQIDPELLLADDNAGWSTPTANSYRRHAHTRSARKEARRAKP